MLADNGAEVNVLSSESLAGPNAAVLRSCTVLASPLKSINLSVISANGAACRASHVALVVLYAPVTPPNGTSPTLRPLVVPAFVMPMGAQPFDLLLSKSYMAAAGLLNEQVEPVPPNRVPRPYIRVKFAEPLPCVLPPIFSFYVPKMMALYENLCRRAKKRAALQAASQHDGPPHTSA